MELEEAIEILKEFKKTGYHTLMAKYNWDRIKANTMIEIAIETLLNHSTKQEKMISKMISMLEDYGADEFICNEASKILYKNNEICNGNCKECIKQYFEKKANEEAE